MKFVFAEKNTVSVRKNFTTCDISCLSSGNVHLKKTTKKQNKKQNKKLKISWLNAPWLNSLQTIRVKRSSH